MYKSFPLFSSFKFLYSLKRIMEITLTLLQTITKLYLYKFQVSFILTDIMSNFI